MNINIFIYIYIYIYVDIIYLYSSFSLSVEQENMSSLLRAVGSYDIILSYFEESFRRQIRKDGVNYDLSTLTESEQTAVKVAYEAMEKEAEILHGIQSSSSGQII